MATAELIATLILLEFSLQHQPPHLHPGQEGGRPREWGWGPLRCTARALTSPALSHAQPLDLTLASSTLCPRVKFWSPGNGRGGRSRIQKHHVGDGETALALTVGRENRGLFLGPPQTVSSPGDSKRPKFLPETCPSGCLTLPPALASVLSYTAAPSLSRSSPLPGAFPLSLPLFSPAYLLLCFLGFFPPLPSHSLALSLLPWPRPPTAAAARGPGVEECVFCFSPVPALPPPPADQERAELAAGRRHLEARQALYAELQTQLDNCPESVREQLQEQLRRVSFTSPPSLAPEGHPPRREESGGTGPPGPCSTCRTPGSVL